MKPIATIGRTKEILEKHGLHAKKKFGQNFIIEPRIIERIVEVAEIDENTDVIEIGPGIGALTQMLCKSARHIDAYEIDIDMVHILEEELAEFTNLDIHYTDFLKVDLNTLEKDSYKVVANLPYYITSKLIEKIVLEGDSITELIVMVQKDVAIKMATSTDLRDKLPLTLLLKSIGDVAIAFDVPRGVFNPAPNVDSAILHIVLKDHVLDRAAFYQFLQIAFNQRRKTLLNNLKGVAFEKDLKLLLSELGVSESVRSEALSIEQLLYLFQRKV